jgi:hypothetical protein
MINTQEEISRLEKELKELTELYEDEKFFIEEKAWENAERILALPCQEEDPKAEWPRGQHLVDAFRKYLNRIGRLQAKLEKVEAERDVLNKMHDEACTWTKSDMEFFKKRSKKTLLKDINVLINQIKKMQEDEGLGQKS